MSDKQSLAALNLAAEFPPVSTEAWEATIVADLKGADYEKKLVWKTDEGLKIKPYYRSADLAGCDAQTATAPGQYPYARGTGMVWNAAQTPDFPADAVRADLWHEAGATAVQELGYAIALGVEKLAAAVGAGVSVDTASTQMRFVFAVGSNFFFEIAKLRAARLLWAQAVKAFGPAKETSCRMKLHVVTAFANKSVADAWTNLLRNTTEALSAVIGGADVLTVRPFHYPARLAENLQLVLKEESHIDKVADPAGGSYYVEALTHSLAVEAWKLFQQVETAGGFTAVQSSGAVDKALAESQAAKLKAVTTRRRAMVGVNNYPNMMEHFDANADVTPAGRLAEPFEKLQARTARHKAKTGKLPKVVLLTRGDLKMRMARAQFCLNFIGCAGFEVVESAEYENSGADILVLCSSDPEYLDLAKEVCPKVKVPVIVAGNPKEQIEALQQAGVSGFIHVMSNAVETLSAWQDRLGMEA